MIVVTADQQSSTRRGDLVPQVLALLDGLTRPGGEPRAGLVLPFERTVGDEVQGLLSGDDTGARLGVEVVAALLRHGGWSVGLGTGDVREPLPPHSREASGPAFVRARTAVEDARRRGSAVPVSVAGADGEPGATVAADTQALLRLLGAVAARRSAAGWEAVDSLGDAADRAAPQRAVARALGISEQAVSQRLRTALWPEEQAARPLAQRLLRACDAAATAADRAPGGQE
jgi:hypothetical protein